MKKQEVLEETGSLWKMRYFPNHGNQGFPSHPILSNWRHSKQEILKILPFKLEERDLK